MFDGTVYIVITPDHRRFDEWDIEVLDEMPKWDWEGMGQLVRIANINGGDSARVSMPADNHEMPLRVIR